MAPSTRLQKNPERRVRYDGKTNRGGSRGTLIAPNHNGPPSTTVAAPSNPPVATQVKGPKPAGRVKAGAVAKPKAPPKEAVKEKASPKKKLPPPQRECSICASTELVSTGFALDQHADACEHFERICNWCVRGLLREKVSSRQLAEPGLQCPFPECDHVVGHDTLRTIEAVKATFVEYDAALTHRHLSSDPTYIACLSPKCGKYFSVEDCSGKAPEHTPQKIACPYCEHKHCLTCNRPWHSKAACNEAAKKEDDKSVYRIKKMGAKDCPRCGLSILKNGGCDHMTCRSCRHNFCWRCLARMHGNAPHGAGCPHGRRNVAIDPGNWVPDNATTPQINDLIAEARRNLDPVTPPTMLRDQRPISRARPVRAMDDDTDSTDSDDNVLLRNRVPWPTRRGA